MLRIVAAGSLAALLAIGADARQQKRLCPLLTPAPPPMEGHQQRVIVGQPQPCPPGGAPEDYAIRVFFGDGESASTRFEPGDDLWLVGALHAYRRAGSYDLRATITDRRTGEESELRRPIRVPNAPLSLHPGRRPRFTLGRRQRRAVVRFRDGNSLAEAEDYRVTISWGDGAVSRGTVTKFRPRLFIVRGEHRYVAKPRRPIVIRIRDDRGARITLRSKPAFR